MAVRRWASRVPWRLEFAENEERNGREINAHGLGKAPNDQGPYHFYKHLSLSYLGLI